MARTNWYFTNINSQFNEGTCTISADGRTLIFTNCEGRPRVGGCDLYISYKRGDEWSEPKPGRNVNSRYWDSQPLYQLMEGSYFSSLIEPGEREKDIWISVKDENDVWQRLKSQ